MTWREAVRVTSMDASEGEGWGRLFEIMLEFIILFASRAASVRNSIKTPPGIGRHPFSPSAEKHMNVFLARDWAVSLSDLVDGLVMQLQCEKQHARRAGLGVSAFGAMGSFSFTKEPMDPGFVEDVVYALVAYSFTDARAPMTYNSVSHRCFDLVIIIWLVGACLVVALA